jgi:hypothetical protein
MNKLIPYGINYFLAGDDLNAQTKNTQENLWAYIVVPLFKGTGDSIKLDLSTKGKKQKSTGSVVEWGCLHSSL